MAVYWNMIPCLSFIAAYTSAITLTTSSDRATAGMDFNFTCIASNSFVTITTNDIDDYDYYRTSSDGSCIFLSGAWNSNYTFSCDIQTYTLTIPGSFDINTLHGSNWSCAGDFGEDISNGVMLYVNVPITKVSIKSHSSGDDNPIKILWGSRQRFTCSSDAGRPAPRIQWYLSETNITSDSKVQADICNPRCNGKVISSSALEYIGDIVDNGKKIYCTAVNIVGHIVRSYDIDIVILYRPSVTIVPDYNPYIVYERQHYIMLSCVIDANPSTNIIYNWNHPGGSVRGEFLTIPTVTRGHSGLYTCNATNSVGTSKTTIKQIEIQYGPEISVIHGYNITEGQALHILPIIDSYPSPTYIWWTRQNDNNFLQIGTPLQIYNIQTKDSDNYTCIVMNTLTPSGLPSQNRTSQRVFNVNVQLLSANKTVKTNTIGIWFGSSLAALIAIAFTGLFVFKYRKRQVSNGEENTNNRVYESTQNVQRNTSEAEQHVYNDIQVIESEVKNQKMKIDGSFNTYEDIWDVSNKKPDHVYQNMKISDKEEKKQQKETAIYVNLELKPSTFT